jgi:hypothetical protein
MKIEMPRKVILKGHGFSRAADSDRGFGLLAPEGCFERGKPSLGG